MVETDLVSVERRLHSALDARARGVTRADLRPPEPPSAGLRRRAPALRPGRFLPGGTPVVLGAVAVVCLLLVAALVAGHAWWHGPVRPARPPVPTPSEPYPTPSADLSAPSPVASGAPTAPSDGGTRQLPSDTTPTPPAAGAPSGSQTGPASSTP